MCPEGVATLKHLGTIIVLAGLAAPSVAGAQTAGFGVDFSWEGSAPCFDPKSPPFTVSGVPAGTKRLTFAMRDLDAPSFPHGGGTIAFTGQTQTQVSRGAFSYKGPCPPSG